MAYISIFILLFNHILWVYIFVKHPKNKVLLPYFFLLCVYAVGLVTQFLLGMASHDMPWLLAVQKINAACWFFVGPLFFNLSLSILSQKSRNALWIYLAIAIYLFGLTVTTSFIIPEVYFYAWGTTHTITIPYLLALLISLGFPMLHSTIILISAINNPRYKPLTLFLKGILASTLLFLGIPLFNDIILPFVVEGTLWPNFGFLLSILQTFFIFWTTRFGGFGGIGTYSAVDFVFKNVDDCLFLLDEFGRIVKYNVSSQKKFGIKHHKRTPEEKFTDLFISSEYESSKVYTGEIIQFEIQGHFMEFSVHQAPIKQWENLLGQIVVLRAVPELIE